MTGVPPVWGVLAATALLFALLTWKPRPSWTDLLLAGLLGLAAGHIFLVPGIPRGHDTLHHLWGVWAVARESGSTLWLHGLGLGMPVLQFYGPGTFYATLPLSLLGLSPVAVVKAGFLGFGILAALTMHFAVSRWTGNRQAALVAAVAYAFAPYRLLDTQYRAAFGECAALALLPLVFLFGSQAAREGGWRRIATAAVPAALLIVTHPISAMMSALGLAVWTFPRLHRNAGVWLLGAALAGFFVVPFVFGLKHLEVGRIAEGAQRDYLYQHGLDLRDLLWRRPWSSLEVSSPAGDPDEGTHREMPFYFGIGLLLLLPLARHENAKGLPWMVLIALALCMGKLAAWISLYVPGLAAIQFPWRFLGLATFGAAAGAGFAMLRLPRWAPGLVAALLILDAAPFTGAADWLPPYERFGWIHRSDSGWKHEPVDPPYPLRAAGYFLPPPGEGPGLFCCAYPEYTSPAARQAFTPVERHAVLARAGVSLFVGPGTQELVRLDPAPYAVRLGRRKEVKTLPFQRGRGKIRVESDGRPGTVLVLEQYFPGWQVLGPNGWREVKPTRTGLLKARVVAAQEEVRFRFRRWTGPRIAGWALTGLASLAVLALARRKADHPPGRG